MVDKALFQSRLNEALRDAGMAQNALAKSVMLPPQSVNNYCKGKSLPTMDTAADISKVLGVSLDWLFGLPCQKGLSEKQEYSCGDAASVISALIRCCDIEFSSVGIKEDEPVMDYTSGYPDIVTRTVEYPAILFKDGELKKFVEDMAKMRKLLLENTIDKDFYIRWIEDKIAVLETKPLDDGLPF